MPWPWEAATACLELSTGQVLHWPWPTEPYRRNETALEAMAFIWRVVHLFHKPKTRTNYKGVEENNWTEADVGLFAWLNENAWREDG